MLGITLWIACAFAVSYAASEKGLNGLGWYFVGMLLGPVALALVLLPKPHVDGGFAGADR